MKILKMTVPVLLSVVVFFCTSLTAYGFTTSETMLNYHNTFDSADMAESTPPSVLPDYSAYGSNVFICYRGRGSALLVSDSSILIWHAYNDGSGVNGNFGGGYFTVPDGYSAHMYEGVTDAPANTWWYRESDYFREINQTGWTIFRNDFSITDSDGNEIDEPLVDENFTLTSTVHSDKTISFEVSSSYTDSNFRVSYFVCPFSGTPDFDVSSAFDGLAQLGGAILTEEQKRQLTRDLFDDYPMLEGTDFFDVAQTVVTAHAEIPDGSLPVADMVFTPFVNLSDYYAITSSAYAGYRGFDYGTFSSVYPRSSSFGVLNFWDNVHSLSNYNHVNIIYAVVFMETDYDMKMPVAVLSTSFDVDDFFTGLSVPDLTPYVPSPDIIDGLPSTPSGSGTDWTVYQHAMFMKYLLNQLSINFSSALLGRSFSLPDDNFEYDCSDIVPYDYDVSVPDMSFPDGLPLELVRPVSLFGGLWTGIIDSLGFTVIVPWVMVIYLAVWFFYGRK